MLGLSKEKVACPLMPNAFTEEQVLNSGKISFNLKKH